MRQTETNAARFARIFSDCEVAATRAAEQANASMPPEGQRGLDCGFAWVTIRPARGGFVNWCRANKKGYRVDWGSGGWQIMCSGYHMTQSVSVHMAAADAFAKMLGRFGIKASTGSRLD